MSFVLYQSKQVATGTTGPLVITKPVSLAVGDVMIAGICSNGGTGLSASGWTAIGSTALLDTFYKVADSADVAATNFTFTYSSTPTFCQGWIARLTGASATPLDQVNTGTGTSTASVSISGITPTKASSLFFIVGALNDNTAAGSPSWSAQAIATNNPVSWTEDYDVGTNKGGGSYISMSMAYGNRPGLTASGNATATIDRTVSAYSAHIFNIAPIDNGPFTLAGTIFNPSVRVPVLNMFSGALSILGATFSAVASAWGNVQKNVSSWTNNDKT